MKTKPVKNEQLLKYENKLSEDKDNMWANMNHYLLFYTLITNIDLLHDYSAIATFALSGGLQIINLKN